MSHPSFALLTGLDLERAEECLCLFRGSEEMALASLVQCRESLPPSFFADSEAMDRNRTAIESILSPAYRKVRETMEQTCLSEKRSWLALMHSGFNVEAAVHATLSPKPSPKKVTPPPPLPPVAAAAPSNPRLHRSKNVSPFGKMFLPQQAETPPPGNWSVSTQSTAGAVESPEIQCSESLVTNPTLSMQRAISTTLIPSPGPHPHGRTQLRQHYRSDPPAKNNPASPTPPQKSAPESSIPPDMAQVFFGFSNNSPQPAASAKAKAGDGETPTAPCTGLATGFGAKKTTPPAVLAKSVPTQTEEVSAAEPPSDHFVGPLLEMPEFWLAEVEGKAVLFGKDDGFMEANHTTLRARQEKWLAAASFYARQPVRYVPIPDPDEETVRVIILDAVRTFNSQVHRVKLHTFLAAMRAEFGKYGQAMSYFAALCLLTLSEQETAAVLRKVARDYIPDHWNAEAIGFATNAWLVERLMRRRGGPRLAQLAVHFEELNFWPDTYLQKIMSGLCIHLLPFEQLFRFLDAFMRDGFLYLVRFIFAVFERFEKRLLNTDAAHMADLYEVMRLDPAVVERGDIEVILRHAEVMELQVNEEELGPMRMEVFNEKVQSRLNNVPKEPIVEPCMTCEERVPTLYCDECGPICDRCANELAGEHTQTHSVEPY